MKTMHPWTAHAILLALALGASGAEIDPGTSEAGAELTGIEAFAMNPAMIEVEVSPDGKHVAALQRLTKDGDPILMIYDAGNLGKKPVRLGASRMQLTGFDWVNNERLIVHFRQDVDTLQKLGIDTRLVTKLAVVDREGEGWLEVPRNRSDRRRKSAKFLQNFQRNQVMNFLPKEAEHVVIAYDDDHNGVVDIFRIDVETGAAKRIARGSNKLEIGFVDDDGEARVAFRFDEKSSSRVSLARLKGGKEWIEIGRTIASAEGVSQIFRTAGLVGGPDSNRFYVISNHETNTAAIYEYDLEQRAMGEMLFHHPSYDARDVVFVLDENKNRKLVGFSYLGKGPEIHIIDAEEQALQDAIDQALPGTSNAIVSRSDDHGTLIVRTEGPRVPPTWYMLQGNEMTMLGNSMPFLKAEELTDVKWVKYEARDGMEIPALVTIPHGKGPFPVVVNPHGGPTARDVWHFNLWAQLLAHHGYVVIQPQFRHSMGFGRELLEAGFTRWGYEMQDDLEDAARYLVEAKLADPNRQAIFGWSYGGYAAFMGSFRDPNPFHCAIAGAGVADIPYLRAWLAERGTLMEKTYRPVIDGISPLEHVESVDIPILVVHGDLDERVPVAESRKFVAELKKHGKQYKYVELKGANHFAGTIYYRHWMEMFTAMIDWLDNTCGLKADDVAGAGD